MNIDYNQLTIAEAKVIQENLRANVQLAPLNKPIHTIAGADISLNLYSETIYAGIVILRYSDLQPLAYSLVKSTNTFPYVPGYLAFREVPALMQVWEQMPIKPDIIMVDGHGIAHPRRMGIASHFGTLTNTTTLGCAKKILFGKWSEPESIKGSYMLIKDKEEIVGYALRSKNNVKPVFISPGNQMCLQDSLNIAMHCIGNYRLPEPTRKAHEFVNRFRTGELKEGYHVLENWELF
ncbi:deoxyribonuclease V [Runella sp.]|uniref:deoxyribonuclease V n=1 Tax=Runella sp. TaxID=1960881 RepID=UPI003D14DA07